MTDRETVTGTMRILILSPYTTGQLHKPTNLLRAGDDRSPEYLADRIKALCGYDTEGVYCADRDYSAPAGEMFTGPLNRQLRAGLQHIREQIDTDATWLDLYFPWYICRVDGKKDPVNEADLIVPFDTAPLHDLPVLEYGESGVPERMAARIDIYDLVFSVLRWEDIVSLQRVFGVERATPIIYLLAPSHKRYVDTDVPNVHLVETGSKLQKSLRTTNFALKAVVLRRLFEAACREGVHLFEQVKQDPQCLIEIAHRQG